ncbi:MAG: hypothetical protein ABWU13_20480, partial [Limnospira maxima]
MDVRELVQSMAASGFFQHEALIATKESGKNIVIEGNRRLAALKVILDPTIARKNGWDIPDVCEDIVNSLRSVPVMFSSRDNSLRFL